FDRKHLVFVVVDTIDEPGGEKCLLRGANGLALVIAPRLVALVVDPIRIGVNQALLFLSSAERAKALEHLQQVLPGCARRPAAEPGLALYLAPEVRSGVGLNRCIGARRGGWRRRLRGLVGIGAGG